ncbi:ribonuclease III, partial [Candidatus Gottesmanbacteria bacterium]|nr:ribonuclease III [Candidatus Gottesmanbacteria bacterium]
MVNLPKFKNEKLLAQALTHRSFLNEYKTVKIGSNERLEFLGDAILSFVTSTYLYEHFPDFEEGQLTNLRSTLVKTSTLGNAALDLDLGEKMRLSKGEENSGGRKNLSILADVFEAVVGALFLDSGIIAVEKLIQRVLLSSIPKILETGNLKDYKSLLQELVQDKLRTSPFYKVEKESGPDHAKTFLVAVYIDTKKTGEGKGLSKQKAEQEAAKIALEYY